MRRETENEKDRRTLTFMFFITIVIALFSAFALVAVLALLFLHFDLLHVAEVSRQNVFGMTLIVIGASLILSSLLSGLALRITMGPINRLTWGLNELAKGHYSTRIDLAEKGMDRRMQRLGRIRGLIESFNTLAAELESTDLLRTDFVDNFSHEFKTPIVSIAGFAKLLRRGNLTEKQKEEYLQIIEEESLRLSAMATNVLNLTKVENQTILTNVTEFNLAEQIRTCTLLLENLWEKKDLTPDLELEEIMIRGNEEMLKEVWLNLLDNAVKFADEGSTFTIRAVREGRRVKVEVENHGPEIPEDAMGRIFQKFYQADESHSSAGNGVGLSVVKRVTELHKGTVDARCENGTTVFRVVLPL